MKAARECRTPDARPRRRAVLRPAPVECGSPLPLSLMLNRDVASGRAKLLLSPNGPRPRIWLRNHPRGLGMVPPLRPKRLARPSFGSAGASPSCDTPSRPCGSAGASPTPGVPPASPWENGCAESFFSRLRGARLWSGLQTRPQRPTVRSPWSTFIETFGPGSGPVGRPAHHVRPAGLPGGGKTITTNDDHTVRWGTSRRRGPRCAAASAPRTGQAGIALSTCRRPSLGNCRIMGRQETLEVRRWVRH